MPSVKSILTDIQSLSLHQQEKIIRHLEEHLVVGSQI